MSFLSCIFCDASESKKQEEIDELSNFTAHPIDIQDQDTGMTPAATDLEEPQEKAEDLMPLRRQGSRATNRYKMESGRFGSEGSSLSLVSGSKVAEAGDASPSSPSTPATSSNNHLVVPKNGHIRKSAENFASGGSTVSVSSQGRPALKALRSRSCLDGPPKVQTAKLTRRQSDLQFDDKDQTVIVFDWDDTLFPTHFINEELRLNWKQPLEKQREMLAGKGTTVEEVRRKVAECEANAIEVLSIAVGLGHVVVVTLAASSWVEISCKHYYPKVGALLRNKGVPVVYALDQAGRDEVMQQAKSLTTYEEVERHWGLIKGRAIRDVVEKFYSSYEGQSWKNMLSVGDSYFERYGILAAAKAYMLGRGISHVNCDRKELNPTEGSWEKQTNGQISKVRAKCCKLVDQPDPEELIVELLMISQWLEHMVRLDSGFDLDLEVLETEEQVKDMEAVLRGDRPVSELPSTSRAAVEAAQSL